MSAEGGTSAQLLGGFSSLRAAAASVSRGCGNTAGSGLPPLIVPSGLGSGVTLWRHPSGRLVVYTAVSYVTDRSGANVVAGAFSSRGLRTLFPRFSQPLVLWPCRAPVVFYSGNRAQLWMKALGATSGRRRPVALGRLTVNPVFDSRGRLVEFEGTTIRPFGGRTISPLGLPGNGWQISRLIPSPRQQSVYLAEVEKPGCATSDDGRLYVVSPRSTRRLATYGACGSPPLAAWSADGSQVFWTTYGLPPVETELHVSDASGRDRRRLATVDGGVPYALWSPDGTSIAYTHEHGLAQVAVVNVTTRAVRELTHIRWKPAPPPRQPPYARVIGWSPDSKTVLVLHAQPNSRRTTLDGIPADGGRPRTLIQIKPS